MNPATLLLVLPWTAPGAAPSSERPAAAAPAATGVAGDAGPYLDLAGGGPIRWRPWGEAALAEARTGRKPLLVDVGAMWCHHCRVMAADTYRDPALAEVIERAFVPVRVDRDRHPEVDARLQQVMLRVEGRGGWPLTAFLTDQGRMFAGGTFFTAGDGDGNPPGLRRLARHYGDGYDERRRRYHNIAEKTATALLLDHVAGDSPGPLDGVVEAVLTGTWRSLDAVHGGFGKEAKFPMYPAFSLLLEVGAEGNAQLLGRAEETLDAMANGAIRDRLGGGFHRATSDRAWGVPRFEKLTVVNAGLLELYARAQAVTGVERYGRVAEETLDYLLGTLSDRAAGGFYQAQAGDVDAGDHGSTYTWTLAQVRALLAPAEARAVVSYYNLREKPGAVDGAAEANVLAVARGIDAVAAELRVEPDAAAAALLSGLDKLRRARAERRAPPVDRTLYSSTNGLAARALLRAAALLGRDDARRQALRTLDRFLVEAWSDERGFARGLRADGGGAFGDGLLQDQTYLAEALAEAFAATGRRDYLDAARRAAALAHRRFGDRAQPLLYDLAPGASPTGSIYVVPMRPLEDTLEPGANAVLMRLEARLGRLAGDPAALATARRMAEAVAGSAKDYAANGATFAGAVRRLLRPPPVVVVFGDVAEGPGRALADAALRSRRADVAVLPVRSVDDLPAGLPPLAPPAPGGTVALLVDGDRVSGPFAAAPDLVAALWPGRLAGPVEAVAETAPADEEEKTASPAGAEAAPDRSSEEKPQP